MADGHIKIDTRIDNSTVPKDLNDLKKMVADGVDGIAEDAAQKIGELNNQWGKLEVQQEKNNQKIREYADALSAVEGADLKMDELRANRDEMKAWLAELNQGYQATGISQEYLRDSKIAQDSIKAITQEMKALQAQTGQTEDIDLLKNKLAQAENNAEKIALAMNKVGLNAGKVKNEIEKSRGSSTGLEKDMKKVADNTSRASASAHKMSDGLGKSFKKLLRYGVALLGVRSIYTGITRSVRAWMNASQEGMQLQADMNHMWVSFGSIFAPIVAKLVGSLRTLLGYANAITKAFFGFELFSKKANKNLGGSVSQAKELRKQLSGFDDMNILGQGGQQNIAGGMGDLMPTEIPEPDLTKFKEAIKKIQKWLTDLWNSDLVQRYWNNISQIGTTVFGWLVSVGGNLWDRILELWEVTQPNIAKGFNNLLGYWNSVWTDISEATNEWLPKITESVNGLVNDIAEVMKPFGILISEIWRDMTQAMSDLWNEYGAPIADAAGQWIDNLVDNFNKLWTHIFEPIIEPVIKALSDLWHNHLKDVIMEVGRFVGDLVKLAFDISNNFVKPIVDWLLEKLQPVFEKIGDTIKNIIDTIGEAIGRVGDIVGAVRRMMNGLTQFISGVFTGDWRKAWNGVKEIFGGVFDGMKTLFKTPINWIIDKLNKFLRGINKVKIPSWIPLIGGKEFNIPTLPRLARGGIVSSATTAIVGEQGKEAVVPLQNNTGWAEDFLKVLEAKGGFGGGSVTIPIYLDGKEIARYTKDIKKDDEFRTNGGLNYGY